MFAPVFVRASITADATMICSRGDCPALVQWGPKADRRNAPLLTDRIALAFSRLRKILSLEAAGKRTRGSGDGRGAFWSLAMA